MHFAVISYIPLFSTASSNTCAQLYSFHHLNPKYYYPLPPLSFSKNICILQVEAILLLFMPWIFLHNILFCSSSL